MRTYDDFELGKTAGGSRLAKIAGLRQDFAGMVAVVKSWDEQLAKLRTDLDDLNAEIDDVRKLIAVEQAREADLLAERIRGGARHA